MYVQNPSCWEFVSQGWIPILWLRRCYTRRNCSSDVTTILTELQNDAWQPHTPHQVFNANYVSCMAVCMCVGVCADERLLIRAIYWQRIGCIHTNTHKHMHRDEASRVHMILPAAVGCEPLWDSPMWVLLETKAVKNAGQKVKKIRGWNYIRVSDSTDVKIQKELKDICKLNVDLHLNFYCFLHWGKSSSLKLFFELFPTMTTCVWLAVMCL